MLSPGRKWQDVYGRVGVGWGGRPILLPHRLVLGRELVWKMSGRKDAWLTGGTQSYTQKTNSSPGPGSHHSCCIFQVVFTPLRLLATPGDSCIILTLGTRTLEWTQSGRNYGNLRVESLPGLLEWPPHREELGSELPGWTLSRLKGY